MSERICPFLVGQLGRDREIHLICNIDVMDGEFGSHESTCDADGVLKNCRFKLLDW